jgi:hypothetical protein
MNLQKSCEETVKTRSKWLSEAMEAKLKVAQLPREIQELECGLCEADICDKELTIKMFLPFILSTEAERLQWVAQTKLLFEQSLNIAWNKQISCWEHSGTLYWEGKADNVRVALSNAPKPLQCKLIVTKEYKEFTSYKAECPEGALIS